MKPIMELSKEYGLLVIEDCAQSHGACFEGKMTGTFGIVGCFSFYPTKNLGAFGDAGAIVTDDKYFAEQVRMIRNYGSKVKYYNDVEGLNSRLDEIQAVLLRVKLKHIYELNDERKNLAKRYSEGIQNNKVILPQIRKGAEDFIIHSFKENERHFAFIDNNEYLGTISLKNISWKNKNAEYAIVTRKKAQGTGAARKATEEILKYAFQELELHKVYLNVLETNKKAQHFYEKCGFLYEGIAKEVVQINEKYYDLLWYGIIENRI